MPNLRLAVTGAAIAAALLSPALANARDLSPMPDADKAAIAPMLDQLFRALKAGQGQTGFEKFFAGTLMASQAAQMQNLAGQFNLATGVYGPIDSWEVAEAQCYVPTLCQVQYMIHTTNSPLFVRMTFYKQPKGAWSPVNIQMGDLAVINPFN